MTRALAIALCALGCDGGGPTAAERSLLGQLLLGPLPPDPTNAVADDERAPDVTTIDALMRKPINSTMSQLAYALYHDPGDPARRFELVADHAARLLASMKENALGLRTAALEGDAAGARHWFAHLKQDCAACHSRFRVEVPRAEVLPR
jgi:hypothetical protein